MGTDWSQQTNGSGPVGISAKKRTVKLQRINNQIVMILVWEMRKSHVQIFSFWLEYWRKARLTCRRI